MNPQQNFVPKGDRIPWLAINLLTISTLISFLTSTIVMIITPKLMTILGVGTYRIAWVSSIYLIASGLITPVSGYLGDRVGMKKLFLYSLAVFIFGSLLCGLSTSLTTLLAARFIQALGGGLLMPISNAIILRIVPPPRLGTAMGVRGISVSAGPSIGPLLGAFLTNRLGWQSVFLINVPIGIIMLILVFFLVPEVEGYSEPSMDYWGLAFSSVMLFSILLAVSDGQKLGWTSLPIVTLFTIGVFFAIIFALWELRVENPLLDLRLFKNLYFAVSMFVAVFTTIGMYAAVYFTPLFAEDLLHYPLMKTGWLLFPAGLAMGVMALVAGNLFDRVGALPLGLIGLLAAGAMTIKLSEINTNVSFQGLMWILVLRSLGIGLALFPLSIGALYTVPRRLAGRASAINSIVRMVPASMGLAYFTYILNRQQAVHYAHMAGRINLLSAASQFTFAKLAPLGKMTIPVLSLLVQAQALARSIDDVFFISGLFLLIVIPLTLLLSKKRMQNARSVEEARLAAHSAR